MSALVERIVGDYLAGAATPQRLSSIVVSRTPPGEDIARITRMVNRRLREFALRW